MAASQASHGIELAWASSRRVRWGIRSRSQSVRRLILPVAGLPALHKPVPVNLYRSLLTVQAKQRPISCLTFVVQLETLSVYSDGLPLLAFTFGVALDQIIPRVFSAYDTRECLHWHDGCNAGEKLVAVPYSERLQFKFRFRRAVGCSLRALTSVLTKDGAELRELLHERFLKDPNIQRLPNVSLIGDLGTLASPSTAPTEELHMAPVEWTYEYAKPASVPDSDAGWENMLTFLEYNADQNQFRTLMAFGFWLTKGPLGLRHGTSAAVSSISASTFDSGSSHSQTSLPESVDKDESSRAIASAGHLRIASSLEDLNLEDGPVFRAAVHQMEKRTWDSKRQLKALIKAIDATLTADCALLEQETAMAELVKSTGALAPAAEYLDQLTPALATLRHNFQHQTQSLLLEPLRRMYEIDIKAAYSKKKEFDQISDAYYARMAKHLKRKSTPSSARKRQSDDAKYAAQMAAFELGRFDYLVYLQDLNVRKEQEILYHFTRYLEKQRVFGVQTAASLERFGETLEKLVGNVTEATKNMSANLREREEKRRALEKKRNSAIAAAHRLDNDHLPSDLEDEFESDEASPSISSLPPKTSAAIKNTDSRHSKQKEGFLMVLRNPKDKLAPPLWKKYWCVLEGGHLHEYSHWNSDRRSLKSHNVISLAFSTVREARLTDRRFCFEILSPYLAIRVYQAVSDEERESWTNVISNSIAAWLEGCYDEKEMLRESEENWYDLGASNAVPATSQRPSLKETEDGFDAEAPQTTTVLEELRAADPSNMFCADCGADSPDWCSINLCVLLCIECSGVHRSLGTHISKVRSLTLDTAAFTPELIQKLKSTPNSVSNSMWEGKMPARCRKPGKDDPRSAKEQFIRQKYLQALFNATPLSKEQEECRGAHTDTLIEE